MNLGEYLSIFCIEKQNKYCIFAEKFYNYTGKNI